MQKSNLTNPQSFVGQQFILRATWPDKADDYVAVIGGLDAARIVMERRSEYNLVWCWYLNGPYLPPHLAPGQGISETLDQAKLDVRAKFDRWLEWALMQPGKVAWQGAGDELPDALGSDLLRLLE